MLCCIREIKGRQGDCTVPRCRGCLAEPPCALRRIQSSNVVACKAIHLSARLIRDTQIAEYVGVAREVMRFRFKCLNCLVVVAHQQVGDATIARVPRPQFSDSRGKRPLRIIRVIWPARDLACGFVTEAAYSPVEWAFSKFLAGGDQTLEGRFRSMLIYAQQQQRRRRDECGKNDQHCYCS